MGTNYNLKPFRFNLSDLNFMRDQINFRPLFDSAGNALINWNGSGAVHDANGIAYADQGTAAANLEAYGTSYRSKTDLQGLRDVTGLNNNLLLVNKFWGAVDQPFLQTVTPNFANYLKPTPGGFYASKAFGTSTEGATDYTKTQALPGGEQLTGDIVDYTPRMISRTITTGGATPLQEATVDGGQVLHWNAVRYAADSAYAAAVDTVSVGGAGLIEGAAIISDHGILAGGQHDPQDPTNGEVFFGAINPGVAPGNSFLAYFGQFFDHGLDFIGKGGGAVPSKITIPLALDDPLYRAPGTNGPGDLGNTKITVSRADISGFDANGNAQWVNHTSPYIDQSQTYGSSAQMTALLREWVSTDGGTTFHAGAHLLDGSSLVQAWTNAWGESTHATLPTLKELNAHLIATGRDPLNWDDVLNLRNRDAVTGDVIDGKSNQALLLDMNPHFDVSHFTSSTIASLAGLVPPIVPDSNGSYALADLMAIINFATFEPMASNASDPLNALAKDVLFDSVSDHYIAGDGRVNENVGLTSIHHVFHEEHNFQVRNIQEAILAQDARAVALGDSSHTVAHDWQVATTFTDASGNYLLSAGGDIAWDEGKLFDAAKVTVEMEYQHAAVDQYARTITPDIPEFVGYNSGQNASVSLEYAQGAFRFGHSTMRETIDFMDPNGSITGKVMSVALEQAFLNPALFAQKGAAAIAMGLTHQQMNEIDELLTPAMNQGLLGQPLDLASINIARGRDVGLPTLNDFREGVGLVRYVSWADFGNHMVHPQSLVNFIAAYSFDGDVAKAQAIIDAEAGTPAALAVLLGLSPDAAYNYAIDFLNGDATKPGADGYNHIDTWLGGLAEVHVMGGLLGETFNLVFVDQIERLMDGDRFYYLYRLNNLNMNDEIANAQLKDIVERNTGVEHLNGSVFAYADQYVDLSETASGTTQAERLANEKVEHKYGDTLAANPAIGMYTTIGSTTFGNGALVTVDGVQYIRDMRAVGANGNPNVNGENLDGTPDTGANANEVLIGTDNKDLIYMWAGDDTAYGEGGNDRIYGDAGIDRLYGGNGDDFIAGGDSGDLIDGGAGNDALYGESSGTAAAGIDQIIGGDGNDLIHGGVGIDKLSGGAGDDVIFGDGDTDAFTHGGDGNDYIDGGTDGDLLWGDGGDDLVVGADNQDIVAGLDGDDILRPGNPSAAAIGNGPDEVLGGDGASDAGNDGKGVGFDLLDLSDYVAAPVGANVDFQTQANPLVAIDAAAPFAWVGIEGLIGTRNNDTVLADANNNWLFGGSGNDMLTGGAGNDLIVGDGIRLDSLIGTYSGIGAYSQVFDTATDRATGFIGIDGLLDAVGTGFDKHFTELLKSEMFKDIELGGATIKELTVNGKTIAGSRVGDGGTAGAADTAVFTGNRADYMIQKIDFLTANEGIITAYKITDTVAGRDGSDIVAGVENFKFADVTTNQAQLLNAAPVITSDGGGETATVAISENATAVTTVTANDVNIGDTLAYAISGGADAALFAINATTGALSFVNAPNFEAPTAAGGGNVYDVAVQVSDGIAVDTQALAVTVQNVNEAMTGALHIASYTNTNTAASLTATNTIADPDLPALVPTYQWQRLAAGNWVNITGTAGTAATLVNQSNITVRVVSTYVDPFGSNTVISDETAIIGTNAAENRTGTAGNDIVLGLGGNDTLTGGAGNDIVDGGAGNDLLRAGLNDGNDVYIGGAGTDTYDLSLTSAAATVNLTTGIASSAQTGTDTLAAIENVHGNSGDNIITDAVGENTLIGNAGNDTFVLLGDNARDVIQGDVGVDTADYSAVTANLSVNLATATAVVSGTGSTAALSDTVNGVENFIGGTGNDSISGNGSANQLSGGDGNDALNGLGGTDTLNGGNGNDTLTGSTGTDTLTGGLGADVFDYNAINESGVGSAVRDVIADFLSGSDKLDFSTIDANTAFFAFGNQAFTFNATAGAAFTGAAQLIYHYEVIGTQEYTVIEGNVNANLGTDFQVALVGHQTLVATDIFL